MNLQPWGTNPALTHLPIAKRGQQQIVGDTLLNAYFQEILGPRTFGSLLNIGAGDVSREYEHPKMFAASEYHTFETPDCPLPATYLGTVTDMKAVPDGHYDWVISTAVLEHVADPWSAAREMLRVAKTGGYIYTLVPFSQIVHYEPRYSDYWRFTPKGLETLFAGATLLEVEIMGDNPARPNGFAVLVQKGAAPAAHSAYWIEFPNELPWQIYLDEPQTNFDWSVYRMLIDPMSLAHQIHNLRNQYGLQAKLPVLYDDVMRQCKPQYARRFGTLGYRDGTSFLDRVPV